MEENEACHGLAFIVEGATEKVFYHEYLSQLCVSRASYLERTLIRKRTVM